MLWFDPEPTFKKYGYPEGVLHAGACDGEEQFLYDRWGVKRVVWFEPNTEKAEGINARGGRCFPVALGSKTGTMTLHEADNGQSSSLLKPTGHLAAYPDISFTGSKTVPVMALDAFGFNGGYDLLVIDTQGFEVEVLRGAKETLKGLRYVYTEVYTEPLYEGAGLFAETKAILCAPEWELVGTWWETGRGWGDAFFRRVSE